MSWLPQDLGTFLAIVALVLMYPVSLLANLSTPWFRDWWAARSHASLVKRRDTLRREQMKLQDVPMIDAGADAVLNELQVLTDGLTMDVHLLIGGFGLVLWCLTPIKEMDFAARGIGVLLAANLASWVLRSRRSMRRRLRSAARFLSPFATA
ncbi:MAG: hypothetical protein ABSD31_17470 [Candidatus Binataceae bacterium]|jgi:hypothetical protein